MAHADAAGGLGSFGGASVFFSLDSFKGYWQFKLDPDSQKMFSFLTDHGVYTPTRVLMGGNDSVAYCQTTVQAMFDDILYRGLLISLDDLLGYADSQEALLDLLTRVLRICHENGLKLNPKKQLLPARSSMVWADYFGGGSKA